MMIPIPVHQEDEIITVINTAIDHQWFIDFLNVPPWKCPDCRLTNFGRNEKCANYECRRPRLTDSLKMLQE